jgi:hypothetical protein
MGTAGASESRLAGWVAAARQPPYRNAILVALAVIVLGSLFVLSYGLALGQPRPRHIQGVIVGDSVSRPRLVARLERNLGGTLLLQRVPSAAAARHELLTQHAYAGLVFGHGPSRLLVASATGASVVRLLKQAVEQIEDSGGPLIIVEDVRPLSPKDPQGLVMFYAMLAATIAGFLLTFQLRANASALTLRAWLAFVAGAAILGGLAISIIAGPVLGALGDRVPELWAILTAQMAIAALVNSTNLALFGGWAIIPTWLLFVIVGNAASGGAVAPPLLPPVYAFIGRWLPSGAAVEALRNVVYFPGAQHTQPYAVLAAWLVAAISALFLVAHAWGKRPMA